MRLFGKAFREPRATGEIPPWNGWTRQHLESISHGHLNVEINRYEIMHSVDGRGVIGEPFHERTHRATGQFSAYGKMVPCDVFIHPRTRLEIEHERVMGRVTLGGAPVVQVVGGQETAIVVPSLEISLKDPEGLVSAGLKASLAAAIASGGSAILRLLTQKRAPFSDDDIAQRSQLWPALIIEQVVVFEIWGKA